MQPEGLTCRFRQDQPSIDELAGGQMRHHCARLKPDAKPLPFCGAVSQEGGSRLRPAHDQGSLALEPGYHHLPAALRNRDKRISALAVAAPDAFDKRRVRESFLIKDNHAAASEEEERFLSSSSSAPIKQKRNRLS